VELFQVLVPKLGGLAAKMLKQLADERTRVCCRVEDFNVLID
jgi:hypothetical protein